MVMVKDEKHVYCKAHASFGQWIDKPRQLTLPESIYIGTLETTGKANKWQLPHVTIMYISGMWKLRMTFSNG